MSNKKETSKEKSIALSRFTIQSVRTHSFGNAINTDSFVDDMASDLAKLLDEKYSCNDFSKQLGKIFGWKPLG